ncbi:MAG: hypothetical protein K0R87_776 [Pseudonocardia sp.]|jgi:hypothetical protein|nr:hypothetical protein [Pseudonocardia sp.]
MTPVMLRGAVLLVSLLVTSVLGAGIAAASTSGASPAASALSAAAAGVPCSVAARACVKLSTNQAWLLSNGKVVRGPVRVSHGRSGFRTPQGTFRVSFKSREHISSIYDVAMPYAVFFNGGIAFHQGDVRSRSHGCIRLGSSAARAFFATLDRGDVVQVVR